MTDRSFPQPLAALRGSVSWRRASNTLTLTGRASDSEDERLILTFIGSGSVELPDSLAAAEVLALDAHHYRIVTPAGSWQIEARSAHVHRDIGAAFYRAIPPRQVPLKKRLFWRFVLMLAGTRAGKRLLLSLRRR
jgi:hypothetical protein